MYDPLLSPPNRHQHLHFFTAMNMHFVTYSPLALALFLQLPKLLAVPLTTADKCTLPSGCYAQCIAQPMPFSMPPLPCKIGIVCPLVDLGHLPPKCFPRHRSASGYEAVCEPSADCSYATSTPGPTSTSANKCPTASPTPTSDEAAVIGSYMASVEDMGDLPFTATNDSEAVEDTGDDSLFVTHPLPSSCYRRCLKCETSAGDERDPACVSNICQDVCPST